MVKAKRQDRSSPAEPKAADRKSGSPLIDDNRLIEDTGRDSTLSHEDAVAGSPEDVSVVGEEDAGIGIEYLIRESEERAKEE